MIQRGQFLHIRIMPGFTLQQFHGTMRSACFVDDAHKKESECAGVVTSFRGTSSRRSSRSTERSSKKNRSIDSTHFPQPMVSRSRSNRLRGAAGIGRVSAPILGGTTAGSTTRNNRLSRTADDNPTFLFSAANHTIASTVVSAATEITVSRGLTSTEASRSSRHGHTLQGSVTPRHTSREASRNHCLQHSSRTKTRTPPPLRRGRAFTQESLHPERKPSIQVSKSSSQSRPSRRDTSEPSRSRPGKGIQNPVAPGEGGSSQGSLLARGRQWLRRKSDKSARAGHAVGEGDSSSPSDDFRLSAHSTCCDVDREFEIPTTHNMHSMLNGSDARTVSRATVRGSSENDGHTLTESRQRHAVRAARAVAEGADHAYDLGQMTISSQRLRASSWSNASATFCTEASAADVETPKCGGGGGNNTIFTRSSASANGTPSTPEHTSRNGFTLGAKTRMHVPHACMSSAGNEGVRDGLWKSLQALQGTSSPAEQSDQNSIPNPTSPITLVRVGGGTPGHHVSKQAGVSSPCHSIGIPRDPSGSSAGSYVVSGAHIGCSAGPVDAPSKLLSMGFASSNMSGTEWSHGSPSLAADLTNVYTLNPGSRLGSDPQDAEASQECSPTIMHDPCTSTTGDLPTPTTDVLGDANTLGSLDGGVRMPVATSSPTLSPTALPMHEGHSLRPISNSSPIVTVVAARKTADAIDDMHARDAWDMTTPQTRTLQGDLRSCTLPHGDTSPPARSPELYLPEEFAVNACHSSNSGNTLSQSLASPLQACMSTVSMSLSIAPMSTIASTVVSGDFSSSVRGSPQKPPLSPHVRARYTGAARMHVANQLSAIGRGGRGGVATGGGLLMHAHTGSQPQGQAAQLMAPGLLSKRKNQNRIAVRRHPDRQSQVSRGGFLEPNHEEDEEESFISGDESMLSAAYCPERLQSGSSNRRNSNQGESILSSPSNRLRSRRVTEESGCGTTPNSSATLGHMYGYRATMGNLSAPDSGARISAGESDSCTGMLARVSSLNLLSVLRPVLSCHVPSLFAKCIQLLFIWKLSWFCNA